ncbi:hypothetical protein B566_EDAN005947 [Ephemera danica]|nr:hypothetical protein B566_EDAN005947 [Ephemera danica]
MHPLASAVHEMISLLGAASSPPLVALLRRVCLQLSDLDPSSALMVGRALLEPTVASIKADHLQGRCSALSMRRLTLLSSVSLHAAPKAALLHLLRLGRSDEDAPLSLLCWALLKGEPSGKAQTSVASMLSALCDPNCGSLSSGPATPPPREFLSGACSALVQCATENSKYGAKPVLVALQALLALVDTSESLESQERAFSHLLSLSTSKLPEPAATPAAEPLATQFAQRLVVFPLAEDWSEPPGCEGAQQHQAGALERLDLAELAAAALPELNLSQELSRLMTPMRGRAVFGRAMPVPRGDTFRSRPPNTSRPPSLHVDDFLALESAGQQPTGPTGYNKQTMRAKEMMVSRPRVRTRGVVSERGGRFPNPSMVYRRDTTRGISRGIPPNLGRGGDPGAPQWSGGVRPSPTSDKMSWERGGGPRRDPRHTRTFSR